MLSLQKRHFVDKIRTTWVLGFWPDCGTSENVFPMRCGSDGGSDAAARGNADVTTNLRSTRRTAATNAKIIVAMFAALASDIGPPTKDHEGTSQTVILTESLK